jgi:hypothetical protein
MPQAKGKFRRCRSAQRVRSLRGAEGVPGRASDGDANPALIGGRNLSEKQTSATTAAPSSSSHEISQAAGELNAKAKLLENGPPARQPGSEVGRQRQNACPASWRLAQHILLAKARDSGGSTLRHNTILGTSTSYSGGAVGTYDLFWINGELECSGDVYEYAGGIKAQGFQAGSSIIVRRRISRWFSYAASERSETPAVVEARLYL